MATSRRDHLVDTALALFAREGYHATGIDRILAQAGCAKMTLYNHFKSKDELILAALRRRDEGFRNWFMRAVEKRAASPRDRLLAVFDVLGDWCRSGEFNGCMFVNAAAEYADPADPIHACCAEHKRLVQGYLGRLAQAAGAGDAEELAGQLMLLAEGAIVMRQTTGREDAPAQARRAAEVLLERALKGT